MSLAALLLLADARFPTGAHAHSAGIEAAHATGAVHDLDSLAWFIEGRLATTALVDATFTAAATIATTGTTGPEGTSIPVQGRTCPPLPHALGPEGTSIRVEGRTCPPVESGAGPGWGALDAELAARIPSPRLRQVSRALGRQLLRAGERAWPSPAYARLRAASGALDPLQPIALGAVAAVAGLSPQDAALCAFHHQVGTWTTAAIRLLGLDPFAVHAYAARLAPALEALAADAADAATRAPADLPSISSPLGDILAEHHATWEVRLFAS